MPRAAGTGFNLLFVPSSTRGGSHPDTNRAFRSLCIRAFGSAATAVAARVKNRVTVYFYHKGVAAHFLALRASCCCAVPL